MIKKRPKKRTKTKPPWGIQQTIAMSLLAHGIAIAAIIVLGWHEFSVEKPGTVIFVHDVAMSGDEGGQDTSVSPQTSQPQPTARASAPKSIPRHQDNPTTRGDQGSAKDKGTDGGNGDSAGTGEGTGSAAGSGSAGIGNGGAGNPILAEIRRRIEQSKRYPLLAREQHIEGKVGVQFLIQSNGQVQNLRVTRSSGAPVLDDAAIQAVQHSAPLPYYENTIDLSLAFRLR